jgi:hypothetical protein
MIALIQDEAIARGPMTADEAWKEQQRLGVVLLPFLFLTSNSLVLL